MKKQHAPEGSQENLLEAAQCERGQLKRELFVALRKVEQLQRELAEQRALIEQIHTSSSWRLTAPLRTARTSARYFTRPRQLLAVLAARGAAMVTRYPRLRTSLIAALVRFPGIREKLRRLVMPSLVVGWSDPATDYAEQMTADKLPPSGRLIYDELIAPLREQSPS